MGTTSVASPSATIMFPTFSINLHLTIFITEVMLVWSNEWAHCTCFDQFIYSIDSCSLSL